MVTRGANDYTWMKTLRMKSLKRLVLPSEIITIYEDEYQLEEKQFLGPNPKVGKFRWRLTLMNT